MDLKEGDKVTTPYGAGIVLGVRDSDNAVLVQPTNWVMDRGQKATFYMNPKDVKLVPAADPPKLSYVEECLLLAEKIKLEANDLFKQGDIAAAREKYLDALMKLRYLGEDLPNEMKAKKLEKYIPISNNIALCSMKLKQYNDCKSYSDNVVRILDNLEKEDQMKRSQILAELLKLGLSKYKLFQDFRCKALYYFGKASINSKGYAEDGVKALERNLALRSENKYFTAEDGDGSKKSKINDDLTDIKTLIQQGKDIQKNEKIKEKETWKKAFTKNSELPDEQESSSSSVSSGYNSPSSPKRSGKEEKKKAVKKEQENNNNNNDDDDGGEGAVSTWTGGGWTNPYFWLGFISFAGICAFSFFKFKPRFFSRR